MCYVLWLLRCMWGVWYGYRNVFSNCVKFLTFIWCSVFRYFWSLSFDFWYLFCVSWGARRVMGEVGVMFFSFLGMRCDLYFLVVGLGFRLCVKLSLYLFLWRGR